MAYIVGDARTRRTPINRRRGTLPAINARHDAAMQQWQRIDFNFRKLNRLCYSHGTLLLKLLTLKDEG